MVPQPGMLIVSVVMLVLDLVQLCFCLFYKLLMSVGFKFCGLIV